MSSSVEVAPTGAAGVLTSPPLRPTALQRLRSVGVLLVVPGIISWAYSLGHIHPYDTGGAGLGAQLPFAWWLGLVLVVAALACELAAPRIRTATVVLSVLALTLILHGTLPAAESVPRFEAAYTIAGFGEHIAQTGQTLPHLDARFSWFGMFAAAGMAARAMHVHTFWFLRWAPLVFELSYLLPVKALANYGLRSSRAQWAVLPIFLAGNWIDQDYFSPQAVALLLYLVVLAVVVRTFADHRGQVRQLQWVMQGSVYRSLSHKLIRGLRMPLDAVPSEMLPEETPAGSRAAMYAVVILLSGTVAIAHQISPVSLTVVLFFLALAGRTRMKTLWLWVGFATAAWVSWEAKAYWSGHLTKVLGGVGAVGKTVKVSVATHAHKTSDLGRTVVQAGRVGEAAVTLLAGAIAVLMLWRRGRTLWTVVILAATPVVVGGLVSYGGEVALRILLFSLAPLSVLIATMIDGPSVRRHGVVVFVVVGALMLALFPLNRFGNESFEAFAPGDLQAAEWVHAHVPIGSVIVVYSRDETLPFSNVGDYKLSEVGAEVSQPDLLDGVFLSKKGPTPHGGYFFFTRSQYEEGYIYDGLPEDWLSVLEHNLEKLPGMHTVYRNSTALILHLDAPKPTTGKTPVDHHRHHPVRTVPHPPVPKKKKPVVDHHKPHPVIDHHKPHPVIDRHLPHPVIDHHRPHPVIDHHRHVKVTPTTTIPPTTTTTVPPTTTTTVPTTTTTAGPTTTTTRPTRTGSNSR